MPFSTKLKVPLWLVLASISIAQAAKVVTIGDSYAAGTGIHAQREDYDDSYCYVETDTIPGGNLCGDDIGQTVSQWNDLQVRYADEAADLWEGSLIILSTGGNSVRTNRGENFEESLMRCVTTHRFQEEEANEVANFDAVQADLEVFYSQLASEAASATVRVTGYPKVFHPNGFKCFIPGITVKEANFFDGSVLELNSRIISAIETVKTNIPTFDIQFVDVESYYTNGACSPFRFRQVRDINLRAPVTSFHPTQNGYDKTYGAIRDTLIP